MKKTLLRGFSIIGLILFLPLFIFTFSNPNLIEKSGKGFVQWKLKQEINKKIDSISLPQSKRFENIFGNKIIKLQKEAENKLKKFKKQLKNDVHKIVMAQILKTSGLNSKWRNKWEKYLNSSLVFKVISFEKIKAKLAVFAQAKYAEIVKKLTLDIRIFFGINSLIFLLLLLISFLKPKATIHLFLPAMLMFISTIVCSYFYIFEQNWFYTIIYNNYTGFGYFVYLTVVFAFMCDTVINKAKITTEIINLFLDSIGSAFSVASC